MRSNHHVPIRVAPAVDVLEPELTTTLLSGRQHVRGAPSDPFVRQLRKDLGRCDARRRPVKAILAILLADLRDGAPIEDVLAFPRQLVTIIEVQAGRVADPRDLDAVIDALSDEETMVEGPANCVQMRLARDKSEAALRESDLRLDRHIRKASALLGAVRAKRYGAAFSEAR